MAALKDRLKTDLVTAMKAKDEAAKSNLRMAIAAIATEEVAGSAARQLSEAEEIAIVTREVNKRKDAAEAYESGGRPELAGKELAEAEYLARYLPEPLTAEELQAIVDEEVALVTEALGEKPTMKQMGQVVKAVNARAAGRADGGTIAGLVRRALA
ncbi:GatB/YqeY domain-containing protein [Aestuariimicrobium ganziense]|uniref:GatB/YqeY domain-containing protein n=1 Tax=Aestuariimicrobium ganziense TaxID=2773677 RepID=UPI001941D10C|nr:GatB/YqeY domain-containing protein [Aestuariimicrobium ganziense]